jgi:hypothetical protein
MAGNIRIDAGVETPAQSRTSVSGGFSLPARPAPAPQAPLGYGLAYQMGGPNYMYGVTPRFGAYYRDGGTPPGQIHGNFPGAREGADMFGFWPTMFQTSPYATASQMYTPGLGVMPLVGYPSRYPHVVMGGYSDYGAGIANQAMGMMLPLLMMGLYRQMFPMMPQASAAATGASGGKKGSGGSSGGGSGGSSGGAGKAPAGPYQNLEEALGVPNASRNGAYVDVDAGRTPLYAASGFEIPVMTEAERAEYNRAKRAGTYRQELRDSMSAARSAAPENVAAPALREKFPKIDRLMRGAALVPGALRGAASNALFRDSTHDALLRARDNPVAVPDDVRRAFGGR